MRRSPSRPPLLIDSPKWSAHPLRPTHRKLVVVNLYHPSPVYQTARSPFNTDNFVNTILCTFSICKPTTVASNRQTAIVGIRRQLIFILFDCFEFSVDLTDRCCLPRSENGNLINQSVHRLRSCSVWLLATGSLIQTLRRREIGGKPERVI